MKFEWFEQLRYLESHTEDIDEFDKKLCALTQQDVTRLVAALQQKEARDSRRCMIL
ncbi:hypothetical protein HGO97_001645 [Faecalicatena sp. AGMB00832]|uniref:Uncharacterized protein n=1 Tax=Faecalicatena faecalis TaxID=2726362 RepID=A0ABS6CZ41_9FIRM|nr:MULTISPECIES: hypothetical protein [Faecalicatena]MBU3874515.1 hypothetical protein [Faecalicatena faecalis]MCI6466585.1 hypothetical protein [Faecalicatena sp.]MDY5617960.1 hypothetical protein [Lachnospiraceae bacterium]